MLTLNDGRAELWQWDTGRTLAVDADCSQVHFSNNVFGRSIDVNVVDGVAIIPDILLQTDKDLNVWAFVGTAENGYTKISKTCKVNRRNKPADYVFTPTEQTTLAELVEQIGNLDDLTTDAKDNLVAAINEAAKSGGGGVALDTTLSEAGKAADAKAAGDRLSALSEEIVTTAESKVAAHNSGTDTHSDIRVLIQGLTDRLNALADSDDTTLDQLSEVVAYIKSNRTLIEAITTSKVSVADIIDNLTTNVANKPLSAAQGVALKALIDAITVPDKLPNPNALTFSGAVTGSYDGSAPLSVEIPSGGSGSGAGKTWELLLDATLSEDTAYIFQDLSAPVTELILEFLAGGDGTHRDVTIFNRQGVGYGKNIVTFKNVLRSDTTVSARFVIHCVAFPGLAFFRCQYNNYNSSVGENIINASSQLLFNDENGAFKGNINFDCISIGCWSGGNSGVFKAGTMVRVYGK